MKHLTADQLVAYQLKELSNNEIVSLENHLQECAECQNELILLGELHEEWLSPSSDESPSDLLNGIMLNIEPQQVKERHYVKSNQSMKIRFIHLVIAAAVTFLVFQLQLTKHIVDSNQQVVKTIEQTSSLMEKGEKISIPISKLWKGTKH